MKINRSIMQEDASICYLCGRPGGFEPLDKHHVFGGALREVDFCGPKGQGGPGGSEPQAQEGAMQFYDSDEDLPF